MRGFLILENGQVFEGERFGFEGEVRGEVVFTTGMTGYLDTLTDPGYQGQIVMQTFPLIGNYGVITPELESPIPRLSAYVVRQWCRRPSNFRSEGALDTFLKTHRIPGLAGIDTRAVTRILREEGTMMGAVSASPEVDWKTLPPAPSAAQVTRGQEQTFGPEDAAITLALWDFGLRQSLMDALLARGCRVVALPAHTPAARILQLAPAGLVLSGGPGNPADHGAILGELAQLTQSSLPMLGIGLGHQLLALARGGKTDKLPHGHRGGNQPVREEGTGRVYNTWQNHGYAVSHLPPGGIPAFTNVHDGTNEGIGYTDRPALSVQFQPDTPGGPQDTGFVYDRFFAMLKGGRDHAQG